MKSENLGYAINLALWVWLFLAWRRSGFLAALNLFLYGAFTMLGAFLVFGH